MTDAHTMYLELLKNVLSDYHRIDRGEYKPLYRNNRGLKRLPIGMLDKLMRKMNYAICKRTKFTKEDRQVGKDWPAYAETMIGIERLNNIQECAENVFKNKVEGDFIETGVWRGGSTIFMKALMKVHGITDRVVWVADSFEGLPRPNEEKYEADKGDQHHMFEELAIPLEVVKHNFEKYNLLDSNVKFLKGWFKDTLPTAPIEKLSLLRLDGDMYESTMDALVPLYPKLSPGGYIIIDDYGTIEGCKLAVHDYREKHGITEEIIPIDWSGVYWQKAR